VTVSQFFRQKQLKKGAEEFSEFFSLCPAPPPYLFVLFPQVTEPYNSNARRALFAPFSILQKIAKNSALLDSAPNVKAAFIDILFNANTGAKDTVGERKAAFTFTRKKISQMPRKF
jgi:hypothetical protein